MNQRRRALTVKQKLLTLQGCSLAGMAALLVGFFWLEKRVGQQVVFPNFETQILNGHERTLKTLVDTEAQILAERVKSAATQEDQKRIIESETDPIRFLEDGSGYFFSYDLAGTRINVPTNKSQNGRNCLDLKDSDGFEIVRGLVDAAKKGGGFVRYRFEKPGKGIQPKLSYVKPIAGTEYFVGTGVYIDDVESERAALAGKVGDQMKVYFLYLGSFSLLILAVTVALALLISRSITRVINRTTHELLSSAQNVTEASTQVSQTSQTLAAGSSEQAAATEQTSASLATLSERTRRNTEEINEATGLARAARVAADSGVADMQAMSAAMAAIKASSDDIAKIIKTVEEIAFQTNILALNAAVEAARAGEAGMGFAVVADEVRTLARRSAAAAEETTAKIEGAIGRTAAGVQLTSKVADALNGIVAKARQMDEISTRVAAASKEQREGIGQIDLALKQSNTVTQSNAATAEESAAAAEELNAQAEMMRVAVMDLMRLVSRDQRASGLAETSAAPATRAKLRARPRAEVLAETT